MKKMDRRYLLVSIRYVHPCSEHPTLFSSSNEGFHLPRNKEHLEMAKEALAIITEDIDYLLSKFD